MPVDTSMYSQPSSGSLAQSMESGMKMGEFLRQKKLQDRADQVREASKAAYTMGPDGRMTLDPDGLAGVAQIDPQAAAQLQRQNDADKFQQQNQKTELAQKTMDAMNHLLPGVHDQDSYDNALSQYKAWGLPGAEKMPALYDKGYVDQVQSQLMGLQAKQDQANKDRTSGQKDRELGIEDKKANAEIEANGLKRNEQKTQNYAKAVQETQSMLESARGNPEVTQALKDRYAASKLNGIMGADPDKLSPQMAQLARAEAAKIAQGGAPQVDELREMKTPTIPSALAELAQKFTNDPVPANQGAFLKQYQDYGNKISSDANKVIQDKFGRVIEGKKAYLHPSDYSNLKAQYLGDQSNKAPAAPPHPQDSEAVAWAKANLNGDPQTAAKAQAILKANGVQ